LDNVRQHLYCKILAGSQFCKQMANSPSTISQKFHYSR